MSVSEKKKLCALYKQCDKLFRDSLEIGQIAPYDIGFQKPIWKVREKIVKIANQITKKFSVLENAKKNNVICPKYKSY